MKNIDVKNLEFNFENLEQTLKQYVPGKYMISWHVKDEIWDMCLKWDGTDFIDLVDQK